MKLYLSLITAAALSLTACSQQEAAAPAPAQEPAASAEVAEQASEAAAEVTEAADAVAVDSECVAVVESNDAMQFNTREILVKSSCEQFTVTLKHTGSLPKEAMGHNIVITKASDKDDVLKDATTAGVEHDYVKPNDERVIAHTDLIGDGAETQLTLNVADLAKDGDYAFFCSFPGHGALMNGVVKVVD